MPPPAIPADRSSTPGTSTDRSSVSTASRRPLLDPCNDFVFKVLFVRQPALLLDLVNAVRDHLPPVADIEILNPAIPPEAIAGKTIVLDILARDRIGQRFNVEMQIRRQPALPKRSVFYLGRITSGQLEIGAHYASLAPVIGIHLLDFTWFRDHPRKACWRFVLRDDKSGDVLPDAPLELNLLELPKADRLGENDRNAPLFAWVTFFKHAQEPDIMSRIEYPPVREAMATLAQISEDDQARLNAEARKRALMDQAALVDEARSEGEQKGLAEAAQNIARQLIDQLGLDDATIARLTGLSEADVERLRGQAAD
ncbi:MAG: Rpn family recombination-promoting nuclease/putative transposase [Burkholderiaceae bacterium]|nr:Rpn family recombination-promoting nuclease/putative transposase [Burkholderiaceae bacterium]MEB2320464.1 Rpn family recombination-promoting nuclease/putative transposase [Pseudomonadota bacterium]